MDDLKLNIPTMQELEDQMLGRKKKEEKKEEKPVEETKQEKLAKLKEQAKTKRQELDNIYKEIEDSI